MNHSFRLQITILLLLAICMSFTVDAQKIEIRSDSVFINSQKLTKLTTGKEIQGILGKANRISRKESMILTYDGLGLKIYLDLATQIVTSVALDFIKEEYDFSPKNVFHGFFSINGQQVVKTSSVSELTQMKEIGFHHSVLDLYTGTTPDVTLTFQISDETHRIGEIAISYSSDR